MPDILTHVLVGYVLGMALSFRYESLRPGHVTLVMFGALSPDFKKVALLVSDEIVEAVVGVPFAWLPLHTLGGTLVVIAVTGLLVAPEYRRRTFLLVALGAASHHALDLLLLNASGYAYPVLWPLTEYRPPAGMLYRSSDRWPVLVAGLGAIVVWLANRHLGGQLRSDQ